MDSDSESTSLFSKKEQVSDGKGYACRLCFIFLLPVVLLGTLAIVEMLQVNKYYNAHQQLRDGIMNAGRTRTLLIALQEERGLSSLLLSWDHSFPSEHVVEKLQQLRLQTDQKYRNWLWGKRKKDVVKPLLLKYRPLIDARNVTPERIMREYTAVNEQLINGIDALFLDTKDGQFWSYVYAYTGIIATKDLIGLKRAVGATILASSQDANQQLMKFCEIDGASRKFLQSVKNKIGDMKAMLSENPKLTSDLADFEQQIKLSEQGDSVQWFDNMTAYIGILSDMEENISSLVSTQLKARIEDHQHDFVLRTILLYVNFVFCPLLAFIYVTQTRKMVQKMKFLERKQAKEADQYDLLVHNIKKLRKDNKDQKDHIDFMMREMRNTEICGNSIGRNTLTVNGTQS